MSEATNEAQSKAVDVPLARAMVVWSSMRVSQPIKVVEVGWREDLRYCLSWGACSYDFITAPADQKLLLLIEKFDEFVRFHGMQHDVVHAAFQAIPEYRDWYASQSTAVSFPIVVMDFEASSLDDRSYPIEVGLAIGTSISSPIEVWSTLIRPTSEWLEFGKWDFRSERVHGITQEAAMDGKTPSDVAEHLNDLCRDQEVWCDGADYDAYWLGKLFEAARVKPTFRLNDVSALSGRDGGFARHLQRALLASRPPHRAGQDAERICAALLAAYRQADGDGGAFTIHSV